MSRWESMVEAESWRRLTREVFALGPNPPEKEVVDVVAQIIWDVEGVTLDEDNR